MRPFLPLLLAVQATFSPVMSRAQLPALPAPSAPAESVATSFLTHMKAQDWPGAAQYFDSREIARFADVFQRYAAQPQAGEGMAQILGITREELLALPPADLFAQFLAVGAKANPDLYEAMKTSTYQILGRIAEDSDQVHLVLRGAMTLKGVAFSAVEVRSFHRSPQGWRLQMPPEMSGLVLGLEAGLQH